MLNQLNQEVENVVRNCVCVVGEWQEELRYLTSSVENRHCGKPTYFRWQIKNDSPQTTHIFQI